MLDRADRLTTKVLDAARRKLLETGTRNRLIHVNRENARANCLNIINERSDDVFSLLRDQEKRLRFKATGKDRKKAEDGEDQFPLLAEEAETGGAVGPERYTDQFLETPLGPEAQGRRLLRLASDARTAEEEQGLNILYLALGFLKWRESRNSEIWREAPLILLPVDLVRNERTSTFDVRAREDDITTNLPLQERLRQDFGIVLPEIEDAEDWRPSTYFAAVKDAVSGQPGWSIDADGIQLGFFSFAKLLMHRDLDPGAWPQGELTENALLAGLLAKGFDGGESLFGPDDKLDVLLDPADLIQVVDADASQTKVIEEVRQGSNLVVQGPPGTGKSQTITNLIAAAAHDGKTVLFVAEKMAALSVVHHRLVRSGLRDICLELHSRSANKKALAQELGRTLMASATVVPAVSDASALRKDRDALNATTDLLHEPVGTDGDTPFRAMSDIIGLIGKGAQPPSIPLDGLDRLGPAHRHTACQAITRFIEALGAIGAPEAHPFRGVRQHELQPRERDRQRQDVLEDQGWRFHRIWSTDWFHRREHEVRRLADALLCAKEASADGIPVRGANSGGMVQAAVLVEANTDPIDIGHLDLSAPAYRRAELSVRSTVEPHEAPQGQIGDLIIKIVDIEGPIHVDEIARRIASAFGKARTGGRIVDATLRALNGVLRRADTRLCRVGGFVLTHAQAAAPPIRDRRAETGAILKAEYLPPMEVTAAVARVRAESGVMPPEEMTKAVARLLGYQRVGPDLSATILACVMQNETRGA